MKQIIKFSLIILALQSSGLPVLSAPGDVGGISSAASAANSDRDATQQGPSNHIDLVQTEATEETAELCKPFTAVASLCPTGCGKFLCTKNGAVLIHCVAKKHCSKEDAN